MNFTFTNLLMDTSRITAMRFVNVNVPKDAVINDARLYFTANTSGSTATVNHRINAQNSSNAATLSTATNDISSRPLVTPQVNWSSIPAWTQSLVYNSPNLASVIQPIVNRPDWSQTSNAMLLTVRDNGSTAGSSRDARSFDGGAASAPFLQVNYQVPCKYQVRENTAYQVRIPGSNFNAGQALHGHYITPPDINSAPNSDLRDSDGTLSSGNVIINFNSGGSAENNHTYDFGLVMAPTSTGVNVEGRVMTSHGEGIRNAHLVLVEADGTSHVARTGSFGYYRFENIRVGQNVTVSIVSKRFTFAQPTRVIALTDAVTDLDFVSEP